jgi:WD40 repeat protein
MVTASDDKSVKIWGVARRKFISALQGHNNWVRCARFAPDGQLIATCSDDKTVRLYDPSSSLCVHTFQEIKGKYCLSGSTYCFLDLHQEHIFFKTSILHHTPQVSMCILHLCIEITHN